jgi:hypothetical protein
MLRRLLVGAWRGVESVPARGGGTPGVRASTASMPRLQADRRRGPNSAEIVLLAQAEQRPPYDGEHLTGGVSRGVNERRDREP